MVLYVRVHVASVTQGVSRPRQRDTPERASRIEITLFFWVGDLRPFETRQHDALHF